MATLEDKILGEKREYYCSSSEDEDEPQKSSATLVTPQDQPRQWSGTASNTGPKGVIKDWQRYKQLEVEEREEMEREKLELIKKLSITCRSHLEEEKAKAEEEELEKELEDLYSDPFLVEYMQKRMKEALEQGINNGPLFAKVFDLKTGDEFLNAVDLEQKHVIVIVHVYENNLNSCMVMNGCFLCLCKEYPTVKFCKMMASTAGVSHRFQVSGVPALLIYKGGQMIGNFVKITDELGEDFFAVDLERLLLEHGLLPDKTCIPALVKTTAFERDSESDNVSLE